MPDILQGNAWEAGGGGSGNREVNVDGSIGDDTAIGQTTEGEATDDPGAKKNPWGLQDWDSAW